MRAAFGWVVIVGTTAAIGAEQSWELRGEVVAIKPGNPEVAVLRLADGRAVEVPIDALAPASQAAARKAAADSKASTAAGEGDVTVRGPFGRPVRVPVPDSIKHVESDAIHCRSAADAADVYRLALAGTALAGEPRAAAEARLREWQGLADQGLVRLGDRWVPPEEARAASAEATKALKQALELMRLGNADLAEEELRKASRINPESGRASFVMGLAYALGPKNAVKAAEHLAEAARREPANAAVLVDLGVVEVQARRPANAVERFRAAMAVANDLQPVVDNVAWAVLLASDAKGNPALARNRMPDKVVDELNSLYMTLNQDRGLKATQGLREPQFVGPGGSVCRATTLADVAKLFESDAGETETVPSRALGFVVAPGHVVCPRRVLLRGDGSRFGHVAIELPGAGLRRLAAEVVDAPADGDVALLKCEGLSVEPLPLGSAPPFPPEIIAVDWAGAGGTDTPLRGARGAVLTPAGDAKGQARFLHSAVVSRGVGGGPVLDPAGRVVGMVAATPRTDALGNVAGFGLPVARIAAVVGRLGKLPVAKATADDAAAAERRAVERTVVVLASNGRLVADPPAPGGKP